MGARRMSESSPTAAASFPRPNTRQSEHRTYTYLLGADEHVLSDIGLTRADVRCALDGCARR